MMSYWIGQAPAPAGRLLFRSDGEPAVLAGERALGGDWGRRQVGRPGTD